MSFERALPLELPPSPFVKAAAALLHRNEKLLILDAGSCEGRNSLYLAKLGHRVVALTNEHAEAMGGAEIARSRKDSSDSSCEFVVGDLRHLGFAPVFDVVLANEVFHQMTKQQSASALKDLRGLTRPGGIHMVSGYVVNPRQSSVKNRERCFRPNELLREYIDAGWTVQQYDEDPPSTEEFNGQQIVHSLAKIIASK